MKQRTIDLIRRQTLLVVAAVVVVVVLAAFAIRATTASAHGPSASGHEQPVTQADVYKFLNDPKKSGLDPKLATRLAGLGARLVQADVTGTGRDAFPGYWSSGDYRPCCQSITVNAAGARRSASHPGYIDVIVAWSAQRLNNGPALTNQTQTVTFRPAGTDWQPIPPHYVGS